MDAEMWLLIGIAAVVAVLAVKFFAKLPEQAENDTAFADQAILLLDQGKVEAAMALAEKRLARFPSDGEAYWYLGKACHRVGDLDRALVCMHKVQELLPEWDASLTANLIKAIKEKQSGASAVPGSGDVPFAEHVVLLLDQGKSEDAIALAEARISKFPADSLAHWYLGKACFNVGEFERALACMNKVRELQPSWDESHTVPFIKAIERKQAGVPTKSGSEGIPFADHAKMLLDQGRVDELVALAEERISDYPGDGQAHWWLGKACHQAGDLERALSCMLKVQDLQPDWNLSHTAPFIEAIKKKLVGNPSESGLTDIPFPDHAKMLLDQGKEDEVIALAEERISNYPGDGQAHWWLGKACYHAGDLERALGCMLKVQDLQPDWDLSYTAPFIEAIRKKLAGNSGELGLSDIPFPEHARMLLDQDKADEAIALAEDRISKFPADGLAHWYLGKACYRVGDFRRALASALRAQELQPDWHVSDTAPFIQAIQEKLAENETKPELKVVTLKPVLEGGQKDDEPINS